MGINRYDTPAQLQLMNTYVPLPYQEIMAGLQAKDKEQAAALAGVAKIGDLETQALNLGNLPEGTDYERVLKVQKELDDKIDALSSGMDLTTPEGKRAERDLYKYAKKVYGQSGIMTAAQSSYDARVKLQEEYNKALLKGKPYRAEQVQKAMNFFDKYYDEHGGIGQTTTGQAYKQWQATEYLASDVNVTDWAMKHADKIKADLGAVRRPSQDGKGYIWTHETSGKVITPQDVAKTLLGQNYEQVLQGDINKIGGLAAGDRELLANLIQGEKMGYSGFGELINATMGAIDAFSFQETEDFLDLKTDQGYWNRRKEEPIAKPIITGEEVLINQGELVPIEPGSSHIWGSLFGYEDGYRPITLLEKQNQNGDAIDNISIELNNVDAQIQEFKEQTWTTENQLKITALETQKENLISQQKHLTEEQDYYKDLEQEFREEGIVQINKSAEGKETNKLFKDVSDITGKEYAYGSQGSMVLKDIIREEGLGALNDYRLKRLLNNYVDAKSARYFSESVRSYSNFHVDDNMLKTKSPLKDVQSSIINNPNAYEFKALGEGNWADIVDISGIDISKGKIVRGLNTNEGAHVVMRIPVSTETESLVEKREPNEGPDDVKIGETYTKKETRTNFKDFYVKNPANPHSMGDAISSTLNMIGTEQALELSLPYTSYYSPLAQDVQNKINKLSLKDNREEVLKLPLKYQFRAGDVATGDMVTQLKINMTSPNVFQIIGLDKNNTPKTVEDEIYSTGELQSIILKTIFDYDIRLKEYQDKIESEKK